MRNVFYTFFLLVGCGVAHEPVESTAAQLTTDEPCVEAWDCRAFGKPCLVVTCPSWTCEYKPIPEDEPCSQGIGVCTSNGACKASGLACKEHDAPVALECASPDNCDDGSPCTADKCMDGWCAHVPMDGSVTCGQGLACALGECCAAKYNVCEPCGDCEVYDDWSACAKGGNGVCVGGLCCHD